MGVTKLIPGLLSDDVSLADVMQSKKVPIITNDITVINEMDVDQKSPEVLIVGCDVSDTVAKSVNRAMLSNKEKPILVADHPEHWDRRQRMSGGMAAMVEPLPDVEMTPDHIRCIPDNIRCTPDHIKMTPDHIQMTPDRIEIKATDDEAESLFNNLPPKLRGMVIRRNRRVRNVRSDSTVTKAKKTSKIKKASRKKNRKKK